MGSLIKAVVGLAVSIPLTGCLTLAAYQRAAEDRAADQFREPGPAEQAWFEGEAFPLSGALSVITHQTRPISGGMARGPKEILTCEGRAIRLIPDTPRNRWLLTVRLGWPLKTEGVWRSGFQAHWDWPEPATFIRDGVCSAGGAFRFDAPDGRYFLMAKVAAPAYEMPGADDYDIVLKPVAVDGGAARRPIDVVLDGDSWLEPVLRQG